MFKLPEYIEEIISRLEVKGFKAYVVGGAVRDMIIGTRPSDYDVATDALPEQIAALFEDKKLNFVGKSFGTVIISNRGYNIEVTTFRRESNYSDGRRPDLVTYSKSLAEDLSRRDFTINALAYNYAEGLVDYFNGLEDIKKGRIKTVGLADKRFSEDYLRILRGIRFSSRLGFDIEEETLKAMKKYSGGLKYISGERVREEFFKMLMADRPSESLELLRKTSALKVLFPELDCLYGFQQKNPNHSMDVYYHSLCVLDRVEKNLIVRLAALFHDVGKFFTFTVDKEGIGHFYGHEKESVAILKAILKRLNSSREIVLRVEKLIYYHMNGKDDMGEKGLKRLIAKLEEDIYLLLDLQLADITCSSNSQEDISRIEERRHRIDRILEEKNVYKKSQLSINGRDLIAVGFCQGELIGTILNYLLDKVLEGELANEKSQLLEEALRKFEQ